MAEEQQPQKPTQTQPLARPRTTRPRPESTIVANFMDDLDSMFGLTPEVEQLEDTINAKKQTVSLGERELRDLEARLRETEKRLARVSRSGSPSGFVRPPSPPPKDSRAPEPSSSNNTNSSAHTTTSEPQLSSPLAQNPTYPSDRPKTGKRQDMNAGMAANPRYGVAPGVTSDYVMVGRS